MLAKAASLDIEHAGGGVAVGVAVGVWVGSGVGVVVDVAVGVLVGSGVGVLVGVGVAGDKRLHSEEHVAPLRSLSPKSVPSHSSDD